MGQQATSGLWRATGGGRAVSLRWGRGAEGATGGQGSRQRVTGEEQRASGTWIQVQGY